jgi:hypothetical protein
MICGFMNIYNAHEGDNAYVYVKYIINIKLVYRQR